jgi:hypothetical protein
MLRAWRGLVVCVQNEKKKKRVMAMRDWALGSGNERPQVPSLPCRLGEGWTRSISGDKMRLEPRSISDSYDSLEGHVSHVDVQGCNLASVKA